MCNILFAIFFQKNEKILSNYESHKRTNLNIHNEEKKKQSYNITEQM